MIARKAFKKVKELAHWLVKTEPENYSYYDLVRLGRDRWNGVRNFRALKYLKAMLPGDQVFVYHTGKEKAIVGVAEVFSMPYPDPETGDPKLVVVDLIPRYLLSRTISLKEIKQNFHFKDWQLVLEPRLSVMPVKPEYWKLVLELAGAGFLKNS
jgi:predicted RNA-binding protein with PUA-like domain